jgi:hypothetical protein
MAAPVPAVETLHAIAPDVSAQTRSNAAGRVVSGAPLRIAVPRVVWLAALRSLANIGLAWQVAPM